MKSFTRALKLWVVERSTLKYPLKKFRYFLLRCVSSLLGSDYDFQPKILGYHTVGQGVDDLSISPAQFETQLDWLLTQGYKIFTLQAAWDHFERHKFLPLYSVILTFDDGLKGTFTHAMPALTKRGLAATVFVVTDYVGSRNNYDNFLNAPELAMMNWEEIAVLQENGWDIQSHGCRHYPLYRLPEKIKIEELARSKSILENRTGQSVDFFCFPYGSFDADSPASVERAGFKAAVTCRPGSISFDQAEKVFLLSRTLVDGHMTLADFKASFRKGYGRFMNFWHSLNRKCIPNFDSECRFDAIEKLTWGAANLS